MSDRVRHRIDPATQAFLREVRRSEFQLPAERLAFWQQTVARHPRRQTVGTELVAVAVRLIKARQEQSAQLVCDVAWHAFGDVRRLGNELKRHGVAESQVQRQIRKLTGPTPAIETAAVASLAPGTTRGKPVTAMARKPSARLDVPPVAAPPPAGDAQADKARQLAHDLLAELAGADWILGAERTSFWRKTLSRHARRQVIGAALARAVVEKLADGCDAAAAAVAGMMSAAFPDPAACSAALVEAGCEPTAASRLTQKGRPHSGPAH